MRSAVLAGLAVLAGCEQKAAEPAVVTVDLKGSPSALKPPVPDAPGATTEPASPTVAAASPGEQARRFKALGTEPFWSVTLGPGTATYTTPEDQKGTPVRYALTGQDDTLRYTWTQGGKAFDLVLAKGTCSDGMSDTAYAWKAVMTIDGKAEQGCAVQT